MRLAVNLSELMAEETPYLTVRFLPLAASRGERSAINL